MHRLVSFEDDMQTVSQSHVVQSLSVAPRIPPKPPFLRSILDVLGRITLHSESSPKPRVDPYPLNSLKRPVHVLYQCVRALCVTVAGVRAVPEACWHDLKLSSAAGDSHRPKEITASCHRVYQISNDLRSSFDNICNIDLSSAGGSLPRTATWMSVYTQ